MTTRTQKLEECIAIAERAGNKFLLANLKKALQEAKKDGPNS